MAGASKAILTVVVVVATCVLVLQALGLWGDVVGLWNKAKNRLAAKPAPETRPEAQNNPQVGHP
jgi:cytochrome c-type biogenesis protein CcmH/NrfG